MNWKCWRFQRLLCGLLVCMVSSSAMAETKPDSRTCDLLVYGSTPGGIACAVRAAREGLDVVLVTHAEHVGGLLTSGLSTMDTLYNGPRAPLYDELREGIHAHYHSTYGPDSEPYKRSLPGKAKTKFEARVVEQLFDAMLAAEKRITLLKGWYPVTVEKENRLLAGVTFQSMTGSDRLQVKSRAFADCSYEADLAQVAGVPYRVGRESREEFGEEHAGLIFMRSVKWPPAHVDPAYLADYRKLNLVHYQRWFEIIRPESTGAADPAVQAYNMRTVLTNDPANRVPTAKPEGYDREALMKRLKTDVHWSSGVPGTRLPNQKTYWNLPELVGAQNRYVEGDWAMRKQVTDEHIKLTLELLYFLKTDESVPESTRQKWQAWGLPKDEFASNGHMPYEIYMRETRRIQGREIFTQNDARLATGLKRAPVHADSISITEWFLDSHACTPQKVEGSHWEGELLLNNITFPGQISLQTLLPEDLDNLLVPVCLSSSHIGWGAIRLEPTWMSIAEAAAWTFVLAQRDGAPPAQVKNSTLLRKLAEQKVMLTFFNDVEKHAQKPWYAAVQYLGTQGYFGSYDALPGKPLQQPLAAAWAQHTARRLKNETMDLSQAAQTIWQADQETGESITAGDFARMLDDACSMDHFSRQLPALDISPETPINRATACRLIDSASAIHP